MIEIWIWILIFQLRKLSNFKALERERAEQEKECWEEEKRPPRGVGAKVTVDSAGGIEME